MDFNEYQKQALTTALPTALNLDYLLPGLVAEVGEVCGVFAKASRDQWNVREFDAALVKELGDVAWFVAVIADRVGAYPPNNGKPRQSADGPMALLVYEAAQVLTHDPVDMVRPVWEAILGCAEFFSLPMDSILQANLDKLASRKTRGALSGSGDDR